MSTDNAERCVLGCSNVFITSNAMTKVSKTDAMTALRRHFVGDWGEVDEEDWKANDQALKDGSRILSAFTTEGGTKFWVITEADRSTTTILLPEDY